MNSGFPVQPQKFLSHHGCANIPKPRTSGPPDLPEVLQSRQVSLGGSGTVILPWAFGDMRDMGCGLLSPLLQSYALWAVMAAHPHMSSSSSKVPRRV